MPHQPPAAGNRSGGRGLRLISKIATTWAANPRPDGGKTVWCEFRRPVPATTPAGPQPSHFVVAAIEQRTGPPAIPTLSNRHGQPAMPEPVGIQHAIPPHVSTDTLRQALCGAHVGGWLLFRHHPFTPTANAACQRCAQLAASHTPA
jgi:hypothetical protein